MFNKNDIFCWELVKNYSMYKVFVVTIRNKDSCKFYLRVMNKKRIYEIEEFKRFLLNENIKRSKLRNPFIVNLVYGFQDYENLYYLEEYAPVELLNTPHILKPLPISSIKFYAAEIILALEYFHKKGLVYTYLNPEDLLIGPDGHIKLNFVFCNEYNKKENSRKSYIEYSPLDRKLTHESDLWSLGIVIYELAMNDTPFSDLSQDGILKNIMTNNLYFSETLDDDLINLITKLIGPKNQRITLIEELKKHKFFIGVDWVKMSNKEFLFR